MNRPIPGTVQVAVRHILSDQVSGGIFRPRTRTITWRDSPFRVRRPQSGRHTVELTCPVCDTSLLAEVADQARTRRTAVLCLVLAAVCAVVLVAALGYAFHEGGRTLPEGQSLPVLFPVSVIAVFVTFVAGPVLYLAGRNHNGVSLLGPWRERRVHQIKPVRGG
ncbi:hypothetical protein SAMN04487983_1010143 [Streptomyces sp. yr375]|uniref:hypothetical protein n=1 Tax=Streptomyces sp. yr375 TaxID=1761906 RepID=UPI0008CDCE98|nr:hypothetical protein [Streptomyces sp. yr375]SER02503.1 hypothetical protein SAMN04487983_1010143 [Streptomyces sp. yr375]